MIARFCPVPVRFSVFVPTLLVTVTAPVRVPKAVGWKLTEMLQELPLLIVAGQAFV